MKRVVAFAACAIALAATFTSPASQAGTAPTITGPAVARYYSTVHLAGTTPQPSQPVTIFARWANQSRFTVLRRLHSDATGSFAIDYLARGNRAYYARAGGLKSTIQRTSLPPLACTVSGPAFRRYPVGNDVNSTPPLTSASRYAAFTATRNGVWAGYAYLQYPLQFAAIRWQPGQRHATVLARFHPGSGILEPYAHGNIDVAGITPRGAIVASVREHDRNFIRTGYVWFHGHTHRLVARKNWTSVSPAAVTTNGRIIGSVHAVHDGRRVTYVVEWPRWSAPPQRLFELPRVSEAIVVDARGDVAYSDPQGQATVRLRSGETRHLLGLSGPLNIDYIYAAAGTDFYGEDNDGYTVRWNLAALPTSGPIPPEGRVAGRNNVRFADARGDFVIDRAPNSYRQRFITAGGAMTLTPKQAGDTGWAGQAINPWGKLAFTSKADGLPHFLRCHRP